MLQARDQDRGWPETGLVMTAVSESVDPKTGDYNTFRLCKLLCKFMVAESTMPLSG